MLVFCLVRVWAMQTLLAHEEPCYHYSGQPLLDQKGRTGVGQKEAPPRSERHAQTKTLSQRSIALQLFRSSVRIASVSLQGTNDCLGVIGEARLRVGSSVSECNMHL